MADESVRSLLATLGFEVDNTGADQFEARFKKLESSLVSISAKINKLPKLNNKKAFIKGLLFGQSIKKGIQSGMLFNKKTGFGAFQSSLLVGLAGAFRVAKIAALAASAALVAGLFKSVLVFKNIDDATRSLTFQAKVKGLDFSVIERDLEKTRKDIGSVFTKLEVFQAVEVGLKKTGGFGFVKNNLEVLTKVAKGMNMELSDTVDIFGAFIQTGTNITELEKFGFFFREQTEAIQRQGTGFGNIAQATRAGLMLEFLAGIDPVASQIFEEYKDSLSGQLDQVGVFLSEKGEEVGRKASSAFLVGMKFIGADVSSLREIDKKIKGDAFFPDLGEISKDIKESVKIPDKEEQFNLLLKATKFLNEKSFDFFDAIGFPLERTGSLKNTTKKSGGRSMGGFSVMGEEGKLINSTVTNNNTFNINGVTDPEAVSVAVDEKLKKVIKDAAQMELRKTVDKGLPLTAQ